MKQTGSGQWNRHARQIAQIHVVPDNNQTRGFMKALLAAGVAITLTIGSAPAHATVYGDDLAKCLVSSTTDADRAMLMKWIFSAMSLNREVAQFVSMPTDVRDKINQDAGGLYMRLLTESCKTQTRDAYKYEGQAAIASAFSLLGQIASQGLFSDPAVAAGMTELSKYFDQKKLSAVIEGK